MGVVPELPEVETTRLALERHLNGKGIERIEWRPDYGEYLLRQGVDFPEVARWLEGSRWSDFDRQGKFLYLGATKGRQRRTVELHLRMSGSVLLTNTEPDLADLDKHSHMILGGEGAWVIWRDVRKFGTWRLLTAAAVKKRRSGLGVDPLSSDWKVSVLVDALKDRRATVKNVLLNQALVAGLGNIYVSEICHLAGVDPRRRGGELRGVEIQRIFDHVRDVMEQAIQHGGTRLEDIDNLEYVSAPDLDIENYSQELRVYGRAGNSCSQPGCRGEIRQVRITNRSTYFCDTCQS